MWTPTGVICILVLRSICLLILVVISCLMLFPQTFDYVYFNCMFPLWTSKYSPDIFGSQMQITTAFYKRGSNGQMANGWRKCSQNNAITNEIEIKNCMGEATFDSTRIKFYCRSYCFLQSYGLAPQGWPASCGVSSFSANKGWQWRRTYWVSYPTRWQSKPQVVRSADQVGLRIRDQLQGQAHAGGNSCDKGRHNACCRQLPRRNLKQVA